MGNKICVAVISLLFWEKALCQIEFFFDQYDSLLHTNQNVPFRLEGIQVAENEQALLKLVICDSGGEFLLEKFLISRETTFKGCFKVPSDIISGRYTVVLYDMGNTDLIDYSEINVINLKNYTQAKSYSYNSPDKHIEVSKIDPKFKGSISKVDEDEISSQAIIVFQSRGDTQLFRYSVGDSLGNFQFNDLIFGKSDIQISSSSRNSSINDVFSSYPHAITNTKDYKPWDIPKKFLTESNFKKMLINANEFLESSHNPNLKKQIDYVVYDKYYKIKDFEAMRDMRAFIKEIVSLKRLRIRDSENELRLINYANNLLFFGQPTFMIDGFIVHDLNEILALDISNVEEIKVSHDSRKNSKIFGRFSSNGIFSVFTETGDYTPKKGFSSKINGFERSN